jgi:uncharacterized membrane protein YdbT with pleckstrin-like domain
MVDLGMLIRKKSFEKIIFLLRRHWLIFLGDVLMILVLAAVPVGLYFGIRSAAPNLLTDAIMRPALVLLGSAYCLVIWTFFMTRFVDFYLDTWIVTNDKILNVEQHGLFSRTVSELDLAKVQDVTSEVHGILATIFNFGNVYVQTAGETQRFVFEQVSKPHEVRKHILELVEADRKRQGETGGHP